MIVELKTNKQKVENRIILENKNETITHIIYIYTQNTKSINYTQMKALF
jgi:hypothetical protein